jgi:hypothetical protein
VIDLEKLPDYAAKVAHENAKYLKKLKGRKPKQLDTIMGELHDEAFPAPTVVKLPDHYLSHRILNA